ncbi:hypothetical protein ACRAWD_10130 [Caulobacter segnis]
MGRIGWFMLKAKPAISDDELLARVTLANAIMPPPRGGVPTVYYGDEQGFTGDGDYADSREDMFPSQVASYNDNRLVGSTAKGPMSAFKTDSVLYQRIAEPLSKLRVGNAGPARRSPGGPRCRGASPACWRSRASLGKIEVLAVFNTSDQPLTANVSVEVGSVAWRALHGACAATVAAPGSYAIALAPLDYKICVSEGR